VREPIEAAARPPRQRMRSMVNDTCETAHNTNPNWRRGAAQQFGFSFD
jgi:hypothetical protein